MCSKENRNKSEVIGILVLPLLDGAFARLHDEVAAADGHDLPVQPERQRRLQLRNGPQLNVERNMLIIFHYSIAQRKRSRFLASQPRFDSQRSRKFSKHMSSKEER